MSISDIWAPLLEEEDIQRIEAARFGRRVGMGERPAVLVIDAQRYMVGEPGAPAEDYPSACPGALEKILNIRSLLETARSCSVPVFYTRFTLLPDGSDAGVYIRKRDLLSIEGWCLEGTAGAEIVPEIEPQPGDTVLTKKKPSAFIGTPLLGMLIDRGVDTVIVTGGSTSNCVRASAVDAASYNFRTLVPQDCVFDRIDLSHRVALFDIDRQYGDVTTGSSIASEISSLVPSE
jgi:nicotinamidase-related amidase